MEARVLAKPAQVKARQHREPKGLPDLKELRKNPKFQEKVVAWPKPQRYPKEGLQPKEGQVLQHVVVWASRLEDNILGRAGEEPGSKDWKAAKGRCKKVTFQEKPLYKPTPDPFGAAISKWSRVWAHLHSRLKEWGGLLRKADSPNRVLHKEFLLSSILFY